MYQMRVAKLFIMYINIYNESICLGALHGPLCKSGCKARGARFAAPPPRNQHQLSLKLIEGYPPSRSYKGDQVLPPFWVLFAAPSSPHLLPPPAKQPPSPPPRQRSSPFLCYKKVGQGGAGKEALPFPFSFFLFPFSFFRTPARFYIYINIYLNKYIIYIQKLFIYIKRGNQRSAKRAWLPLLHRGHAGPPKHMLSLYILIYIMKTFATLI